MIPAMKKTLLKTWDKAETAVRALEIEAAKSKAVPTELARLRAALDETRAAIFRSPPPEHHLNFGAAMQPKRGD